MLSNAKNPKKFLLCVNGGRLNHDPPGKLHLQKKGLTDFHTGHTNTTKHKAMS